MHDLASETSEKAVLCYLIIEPWALPKLRMVIKPEMFLDGWRRKLYKIMLSLDDTTRKFNTQSGTAEEVFFDMNVIRSEIDRLGKGDEASYLMAALLECQDVMPTPNTIPMHIRVLSGLSYRRQILEAVEKVAEAAYDLGSSEAQLGMMLGQIGQSINYEQDRPVLDPRYRAEHGAEMIRQRQEGVTSDISTGYIKLDNALGGGWVRGTSSVVTAVTGGFKTTFAQSMARRMAMADNRVLFISFEMPEDMLIFKDVSALTGISVDDLRGAGRLTEDHWVSVMSAFNKLYNANYYTWPYNGRVEDIWTVAKDMKDAVGLDVVITDYLQIADQSNAKHSRYDHVSHVSGSLRMMAKDLDVASVAMAQMSRGIYESVDMVPHARLLKESGSIENDSTAILGLYFPWGVSQIPGKYVPEANKPWTEEMYVGNGAVRPPVNDEETDAGVVPSTFEIQALVLKNRYGMSNSLVRLGVNPAANDIFCPYVETAYPDVIGIQPQMPKLLEEAGEMVLTEAMEQALVFAGNWGSNDGEFSLVNEAIKGHKETQIRNPYVDADDMI